MSKLCNVFDELDEVDKRVYALELLSSVDVSDLSQKDYNSWQGLLFDFIDLLHQSVGELRTVLNLLDN